MRKITLRQRPRGWSSLTLLNNADLVQMLVGRSWPLISCTRDDWSSQTAQSPPGSRAVTSVLKLTSLTTGLALYTSWSTHPVGVSHASITTPWSCEVVVFAFSSINFMPAWAGYASNAKRGIRRHHTDKRIVCPTWRGLHDCHDSWHISWPIGIVGEGA
jgi:hypothetical protein